MLRGRIFAFFIIIAAASIASTAANVVHSIPHDQLKKRNPIAAALTSSESSYAPNFDSEQQEYLNAHNFFRRNAGVPPLAWDSNLTAEAHGWALQRQGDCDYHLHSSGFHSENIFWMEYKEFTPNDVVQHWFDEQRFYNHRKNVCRCRPERDGCECGHYLNVIWSTTKRVGCSGAVYCNDQKGVYVVCEYDPAGLIPGVNPFTGRNL